MTGHDRFAAFETIHRFWYNYDEGNLSVIEGLFTDDCYTSSRTELGNHPQEEFIRSENRGRAEAMAWTREHRRNSPYPLRHNGVNLHTVAETGDEIRIDSYLLVTKIIDLRPSTLSSGLVHWTLVRTDDGYRVREKHTVLDSIESAPFHSVDFVKDRQATW